MKKIATRTIIALLVVMTAACVTTTSVTRDNLPKQSTVFAIVASDDPIGLSTKIIQNINDLGYKVERISKKENKKGQEPKEGGISSGTGFLINTKGILVTANHVVLDAKNIKVIPPSGKIYDGKVLKSDPSNDIAILEAIGLTENNYIDLVGTVGASVGDDVRVIGYPLADTIGVQPRITDGIISAMVGLADNPTQMQITAPIQPGNSGGPILNARAQAIAMATEKLSDSYSVKRYGVVPQNVNFGVKTEYIRPLCSGLTSNEKTGAVRNLKQAIDATVLLLANAEERSSERAVKNTLGKQVLVEFQYTYYWDVVVYQIPNFQMTWTDSETGEIIASVHHTGTSLGGANWVVDQAFKDIKLKIKQ